MNSEIIKKVKEIQELAFDRAGCSCEDVLKDGLLDVAEELGELIELVKSAEIDYCEHLCG